MTSDDSEFGELADLDTEAMHAVGKAANGTSFLVAKSAAPDGAGGLLDPELVRDLVAKADATEAAAAESVTVTGSPGAIARMIHAGAVRKSEPLDPELDKVVKAADDEYVAFVKAKYTAEQKRKLASQGHAMRNSDGEPDYPIDDAEDLGNAIRAVGRGGADHDKIRRYVMRRARELGQADRIPENWAADGSLKKPAAVAKADLLGGTGAAPDPGSPAWETQDAGTADGLVASILALRPRIEAFAAREGAEVGAGEMSDLGDVCDLQTAKDLLMQAAKLIGGVAVAEHAEAGTPVTKAQPAPTPAAAAAPAPKENAVSETQTASPAGTDTVAKADGALTDAQLAEIGRAFLVKKAAKAGKKKASGGAMAPAENARVIPGTDTVQAPAQGPDEVAKAQASQLVAALGEVMAPVVKQLGELATQVGAQQERVEKAMARPDDRNSPKLNGATGQMQVADRNHADSPVNSTEFQAVLKSVREIADPEAREVAQRAVGLAAIKGRFGHAG